MQKLFLTTVLLCAASSAASAQVTVNTRANIDTIQVVRAALATFTTYRGDHEVTVVERTPLDRRVRSVIRTLRPVEAKIAPAKQREVTIMDLRMQGDTIGWVMTAVRSPGSDCFTELPVLVKKIDNQWVVRMIGVMEHGCIKQE